MKSNKTYILSLLMVFVVIIAGCSSSGSAANGKTDFPKKPINLIVPFAAGGGMDILARGIAEAAPEHLGQPIVVVNRDGAGGTIGVTEGSKGKADGYTITLAPSAVFSSQPHMREVPYSQEDFEILTSIVYKPNVLVANIDSPYNSIEDILEDAKSNGKSFKVGHPGVGSPGHLAAETLFNGLDINFEGVPFPGNNPNITVLLGGHIDFSAVFTDEVLQHVKDGKLKILGVFTPERFEQIPDIPTVGEEVEKAGLDYEYKDQAFATSLILLAPKDTPTEIVEFFQENLKKIGAEPKFLEFAEKSDIPIKVLDGNETKEKLDSEGEVFKALIEKLDIGM